MNPFDYLVLEIVVLIAFVLAYALLSTLRITIANCDPRNRAIQPWHVWLNLIPIFNQPWSFLTAIRVAKTLENECVDCGLDEAVENRLWQGRDYGKALGLSVAMSHLAAIVFLGAFSSISSWTIPHGLIGVPLVLSFFVTLFLYLRFVRLCVRRMHEVSAERFRRARLERRRDVAITRLEQ